MPQKPKLPRGKKGWSVTQEADARSYRMLFASAPVGIFRSTPAGRFIEVNPALVQMLGYASAEDVLTLQLPDDLYVDPAQREALRAQYEAGGLLDGVAVRWKRKDGEKIVVSLYARTVRDARGRVVRYEGIVVDITARTRLEDALQQAEARYRTISHLISDYAYAVRIEPDGHTVVEWVTEAFARLTGFTTQELAASGGIIRVVHPEDFPAVLQRLSVLLTGQPGSSEHRVLTKSGEVRWLRDYSCPEWDASQNRVVRIIGAGQDITEQKHAEAALRESEARYRTLFENANDMLATFTLDGIITGVNRGLEVALGWSRDELIGRHYCKLATPQALTLADDRTSRALAGEELPSIFAAEILRKDGSVVPIEVRSRFIRDAEGHPTGIQGIFRDLTERRRADAALRESEACFRTLANAAPVMLWMAGLDAGRTFFTQPWLELTGRTLEHERGSGWLAGMHPEDVPPYQERSLTAFHARQPFCLAYRLRRADGVYRWVLETGVPHHTAEGAFAGYMGACLDITERKQAEADLRESQRLFQQLADTIPDILYLYDVVEQRTIYINRQFATVLGYTPDELQAMGPEVLRTLLHPDDVAQFAASHPHVATAQVGDLPEVQYRLRHANGEWRWLKSRERVFSHTATGTPTQLLGIAQDITTQKRLRELLHEQPTQRPEVADNLRRFRESLDLSQTEFGRAFGGYSQRQISSYESGESEVPLALLLDIRAKGYPFEVILGASSTAALTKTVGSLSASQQRHTLAKQLADALVRLLDRDSQATDTVLRSLGVPQRAASGARLRLLEQLAEEESGTE
jgi:PAS domain S-box-containing protein